MNQQPKSYTPAQQGKTLDAMIDKAASTPMKVISADDDAAFISKVRHTMLPNEHVLEYCARVGLGPGQAQFMTAAEITAFVDAAMKRSADTAEVDPSWNRKIEVPKRFKL